MSNNWFTVKVRYTRQNEDGSFKRLTEPYLLAAISFCDAEARIHEELGSIIKGEFNVVSIARTELHDIFAYDDAEVWYVAKTTHKSEADDAERSKSVNQTFLVSAHSVKDAYNRVKESLSTLMVNYEIKGVVVSPIVDIFPHKEELDREISRQPMEVLEDADKEACVNPSVENQD